MREQSMLSKEKSIFNMFNTYALHLSDQQKVKLLLKWILTVSSDGADGSGDPTNILVPAVVFLKKLDGYVEPVTVMIVVKAMRSRGIYKVRHNAVELAAYAEANALSVKRGLSEHCIGVTSFTSAVNFGQHPGAAGRTVTLPYYLHVRTERLVGTVNDKNVIFDTVWALTKGSAQTAVEERLAEGETEDTLSKDPKFLSNLLQTIDVWTSADLKQFAKTKAASLLLRKGVTDTAELSYLAAAWVSDSIFQRNQMVTELTGVANRMSLDI
jgi:hypothetical protein